MAERPQVYNVRQAARRVERSRWTVQRWLHDGLPHRRRSDQVVEIDEADLTAWLRARTRAQRASWFHAKDAA